MEGVRERGKGGGGGGVGNRYIRMTGHSNNKSLAEALYNCAPGSGELHFYNNHKQFTFIRRGAFGNALKTPCKSLGNAL